jgi:CBS domain-containing protein
MPEFKDIAASIKEKGKPKKMTVRVLMKSIGQMRRGKNVNRKLRGMLTRSRLTTEPDFELVHIDSTVSIKSMEPAPVARKLPIKRIARKAPEVPVVEETDEEAREVVLTIGQLPSAERKPVFLARDESLEKAITLLLQEGTDHLVVSQNERTAEGLITWQSIGRACASRQPPKRAADCMEQQPLVVRYDAPLFDTVREITRRGFVLVLSSKNQICGSVTSRDIAEQFVTLSEPFLFLEQIENHLRGLLRGAKLGQEAIRELTDPAMSPAKPR